MDLQWEAECVFLGEQQAADAVATKIGNRIIDEKDIEKGIELAKKMKGLKGVVIVKNDKIGFWGDIY